jgi:predicted membrane protein
MSQNKKNNRNIILDIGVLLNFIGAILYYVNFSIYYVIPCFILGWIFIIIGLIKLIVRKRKKKKQEIEIVKGG